MAVVLLVALRVTIGWHFLYEGVWKIAHPDRFSATPFLTTAKGPAAPLFYAMVYDIDGRARLGRSPTAATPILLAAWQKISDDARVRYGRRIEAEIRKRDEVDKDPVTKKPNPLGVKQTDELKVKVDAFMRPIEAALWNAQDRLADYLDKNRESMVAFLTEAKQKSPEKVSDEARAWLGELQAIEKEYFDTLRKIAEEDKVNRAAIGSLRPLLDELELDAPAGRIVNRDRLLTPGGKPLLRLGTVAGTIYLKAWDGQRAAAIEKYGLGAERSHQANRVWRRYAASLEGYLEENREDINAYFGSLRRFEDARRAGGNNTAFQKKRTWDEQQKLRAEVNKWLDNLDAMGEEYRLALWSVLDEEQKAQGSIPVGCTRSDLMDFAVTWGLTAIGLCMVVGLCNRLACLGGAAFLVSVLLTQPPWPTIYPPAPEIVGHALIVDKNFVEMVAMLALACLPVGRWGGLDAFLYRWIGRPLLKRFGWKSDE